MKNQPNIKQLVKLVHEGFSYEQIKSELKTQHPNIEVKNIRKIMGRIDREFEYIAKQEQNAYIVTTLFRLATVVTLIGLSYTVYNYINVGVIHIFSLGILGFGITLFLGGIARRNKTA